MIIIYRRGCSEVGYSCNIAVLDWTYSEIDMCGRWCPNAKRVLEKPEWESYTTRNRIEKHNQCVDEQ